LAKHIFILILSFQFLTETKAQLINIESWRSTMRDTLQGQVAFALQLTQNTKSIHQITNSIGIHRNQKAHTFLFLNNILFVQVNNEKLVNSGYQHFRYNYTFRDTGRFTLEGFVQHQYNSVRFLKTRFLLGFGPRLKIIDKPNFYMFFASPLMYEYEELTNNLEQKSNLLKGDIYISTGAEINSQISFWLVTYYQPDILNFSDFRLSTDSGVKFVIYKRLSISFVYSVSYDSQPPSTIPKTFYTFNNVVSYSF